MELYDYQKEGAREIFHTLQVQRGAMLSDEPGLGKTAQVIEVANLLMPQSVLVICPATLKINWQREFETWDLWGRRLEIVKTKDRPQTDFLVCNYEILSRVKHLDRAFDLVIIDESHRLKTAKAACSKASAKICDKAGRIIEMTGTPMENRPSELWHQFRVLGWCKPDSYPDFAKTFCDRKLKRIYLPSRPKKMWGVQYDPDRRRFYREIQDDSGATNLPRLREFMFDTMGTVRRKKEDVLKDLPPKTYRYVELPRTSPWKSSILQEAFKTKTSGAFAKKLPSLAAAAVVDPSARAALVEAIAEARRLDGEAKIAQAISYIKDQLESVEKIVVPVYHKSVFKGMLEGLAEFGAVGINGETPNGKRQDAVDAFQNDPDVRVFVGQIKSAGVGITLTAASHVVFVELDWVPAMISQMVDRCHRIGQRDNVTATFLVFENSTDSLVAKSLIAKQKVLDDLLEPIDIVDLLAAGQ